MTRILLSGDDETVEVRVINYCPVSCNVFAGELLTTAEPADSRLIEDEIATTDSSDTNVQCLIDSLPVGLTDEQRRQAESFLKSYSHVFSKSTSDFGRNRLMPHRINTNDHPPVKQQLRRQPYAYLTEIERNVQELLAAKVIEPAQSPWSSNVCMVRKKRHIVSILYLLPETE